MEVSPDGRIWMMANTIPNALYVYDQSQFTSIPLPGPSFTYHRNSQANICVGANNHLWAILADDDNDKHYVGEYDGSSWTLHDLSPYGVFPEAEDAWALDTEGNVHLLCRDRDEPALLRYDGLTWTTIAMPQEATDSEYVSEPLSIDAQNHIRILLEGNALLHYDGMQWSTIQLSALGFGDGHPEKLLVDAQAQWWMIQDQETGYFPLAKLFNYNGSATQLIDLSNSDLPTNELYSVYIDELNNKWMQSTMGLLKYNGQTWNPITFPEYLDLYAPLGSDRAGGIWLKTFDNFMGHFDGVAASTIPVVKEYGGAVDWVDDMEVDQNGRIMASAYPSKIMVFDHGQISYLPQIIRYIDPEFSFPDYPNALAFNQDGVLYALGSLLYRFEADSSWTSFPLWDELAYAFEMTIAPDSVVWVANLDSAPDSYIFNLFNGQFWTSFDVPSSARSLPKWDIYGHPWFITYEGLCQYANQTWTCYNRSNSPVPEERIVDFAIDASNNFWIALNYGGLLLFNQNEILDEDGEELPTAGGKVYRDINQNGFPDTGDTPLAFHRILMLPDSVIAFSRYDGQYRMSARNGEHEVKYVPKANWNIDNTPASYAIHVEDQSIINLDFALTPDQEKVDLNLFLSEGFPRCNTTSRYTLSYNNWGTMAEDLLITLVLDHAVTPTQINPEPDMQSGDTLSWHVSNLLPFATSQINLDLLMPGVEQQVISFRGYIDRITNEAQERADSIMVTQVIRCSFDPNDKIARTARVAGSGKFYPDDPIDYTIRFQNTGNDTAFQIVVRDTLDANLDISTLEILGASHPYEAFLKTDRTLEFRFYDILLPDSTTNELESHGFVSYRIIARAGLTTPVIIRNTAHIYFDFNGSIQTNTAISELIEFGTGIYDEAAFHSLIHAYPNPAKNELWIEAISGEQVSVSYTLMGMNGQPVLSGVLLNGETRLLSMSSLPAGWYILHAGSGHVKGSVIVVKGE